MKHLAAIFLMCFLGSSTISFAQDEKDSDYVEFNDRRSVVHGFYAGPTAAYGEINGEGTYIFGVKGAYVANQKYEMGFSITSFYSELSLFGGYAGLHFEPIFFSKSKFNLSFPLLVGVGVVDTITAGDLFGESQDDSKALFIVEPGTSMLFNISRFVQLEATLKYRFSSKFSLLSSTDRINGFSAGLGVKVGIFNMGRDRYKKKN